MPQLVKTGLTIVLFAISTAVLAHPGHDHSSWESPLVHTLFYGSIALASVAVTLFVVKKSKTAKKQNGEQK